MTLRPDIIAPAPSVMVVEDQPGVREMLTSALTGWGFEVLTARSGEEAIRMMARGPGIVLLDLNLPGMDGIETLEKIRELNPRTQAIILTGFGDLETARKAIRLDVVDFLTKPCRMGELEQAIYRAQQRLPRVTPLPVDAAAPAPANPGKLEDMEREHILAALKRHQGNRSATAQELGVSLRTLYYRLGEYQEQGYAIE